MTNKDGKECMTNTTKRDKYYIILHYIPSTQHCYILRDIMCYSNEIIVMETNDLFTRVRPLKAHTAMLLFHRKNIIANKMRRIE